MKDLLAAAGMAYLIATPIAAVFLFRREEKTGWLPPENESAPVTYPADEKQREEMTQP